MKSIMACASVGGTFKVIDNFEGCEQLAYEHIDDFFKIARSRRGVFQGCFAKRYNQDEGHYVYLYKGPQSAETSAAECDYYIAVLETMNPAAFRDENLDSTLQLFAPTDIEVVNAMKNKKADFTRQKANPIPQFSLDKKILTAILDGCMARAINRCEPVDISLPDENFEQTMRQVIKTIYSYMPYRLRAFSGYITSTETWAFPEFSSLRFYRNSDRQEKTLTLNPNECQMAITKIENASSRLPEATKAYLDYLITCTPSERRKLHDDFWTELEGNGSLDIFSNTNNFRQYGEEFVKRKAENRLPHSENQFSPILQAKRKENIEIVLGEIYSILSNQYLSPDDKLMQITKIAQNSNHLLESTQTMEKEL